MKSIRLVKQHDEKDCGAASLCMVAIFYGKKHSLRYMRELTHTNQSGVTMRGIVEGAQSIGIQAEAYEASIEELAECLRSKKTDNNSLENESFCGSVLCEKRKSRSIGSCYWKILPEKRKIKQIVVRIHDSVSGSRVGV